MIETVEMLRNSVLPIVEENKFVADKPCTDEDVMKFLKDLYARKDKTELFISHVDWESRPYNRDRDGMSDVFLIAVKLPDGRYYLTLELPDLENEDPVRAEYILML